MARAKPKLPKWTGALAKPIDIGMDAGLAACSPSAWEKFWKRLRARQVEKLPELARQLGLPPRQTSNNPVADQYAETIFLERLAIELAVRAGIPGFRHKAAAKWPKALVGLLAITFNELRARGDRRTAFQFALEFIRETDPSLRPRASLSQAKRAARQLHNRISKVRAEAKRESGRRTGASKIGAKKSRLH